MTAQFEKFNNLRYPGTGGITNQRKESKNIELLHNE